MDFVTHSIAWCRGEIFEGRMFGLFGLVVLMVAMAYWKMAATPSARAIGLSMAMFGLSVLFLDHFSEVRAEIYHAHILDYLAR